MPGRSSTEGVETPPITTRPRSSPVSSSVTSRIPETAASAARAYGSTASPTAVSRTARPDRSNSGSPSSRSSWRICALTPGWATCSRAAALVKPASSATATKYSSCRSSMGEMLTAAPEPGSPAAAGVLSAAANSPERAQAVDSPEHAQRGRGLP